MAICSYIPINNLDTKSINDRFRESYREICYLRSITGAGGAGVGTINAGIINRLTYYAAGGTTVSSLSAISPNRVLISDTNGLPTNSSATNVEIGYLVGVTSGIQAQFSGKEPSLTGGSTLQYFRGDKSLAILNTSIVPEVTNLYYTDARARAAISLTTTGTSGASTYVGGVLNIPQYAGGSGAWGAITGTLTSQTDLNTALGLKATIASPSFTGIPSVPNASTGTNTTQAANTAFVQQEFVANTIYFSPDFTGAGTVGSPISNTPYYFSNQFSGAGTIGNPYSIIMPFNTLTTIGTSGVATLSSGVLNIPNYTANNTTNWGTITGTLASQTDLNAALTLKAPLISPVFVTPRLNSSSSIGHVWTAIDTSGNGSFQAPSSAGQTPWVSNINANQFNLTSLKQLEVKILGTNTATTLNPADKSSNVTLSNGNLSFASSSTTSGVRGIGSKTTGKHYWECTINAISATNCLSIGIANNSYSTSTTLGTDVNSWAIGVRSDDSFTINNNSFVGIGTAVPVSTVIGFALDLDNGTISFYINNTQVLGTTAFTGITGTIFPAISSWADAVGTATFNFGSSAMVYTPPAGFTAGFLSTTPNVDTIYTDSSGRVGIGITTPASKLEVSGSFSLPIGVISSNYTLLGSDYTVLCSNTITITLPTSVGITGRIYVIKNVGVNTVTVDTTSSQTIDGASTKSLTTQYTSITLQSNGLNWYIIATT